MPDQQTEIEVGSIRDSKALEGIFRTLWDRVKRAAELIDHLKEENRNLRSAQTELEEQGARLRKDLNEKEDALRDLREQHEHLLTHSNSLFSDEDKEALRVKVKELIGKINSHL